MTATANISFQRRHFEFLASYFRGIRPCNFSGPAAHAWDSHVEDMAIKLANTNPRYNKARFLDACGYSDDV